MKRYPDKPYSEQKRDAQTYLKTMGIYENPKRKRPRRRAITVTVIAVVILVGIYFLFGFTYEPPVTGTEKQPELSPFAQYLLAAPDIGSPS